MAESNTELLLYRGQCHADGVSEGYFSLDAADRYSRERSHYAMQTVQKYLSDIYRDWSVQISGTEGAVKSEEEALELINFAQRNIEGAEGIVKLLFSNHGRIVFDRKIRFNGWPPSEKVALIEMLEQVESQKMRYVSARTLEQNLAFLTDRNL